MKVGQNEILREQESGKGELLLSKVWEKSVWLLGQTNNDILDNQIHNLRFLWSNIERG